MNGLTVLFVILKILGILFLTVLLLAVLVCVSVLFVPVRYVIECRSRGHVRVGFRVSWLFRVVQIRKAMSESRIHIYLFGINIRNFKNLFRKEKDMDEDRHVTNSRVDLVDDFYDEAVRHEEAAKKEEESNRAHVETDYEEKEENPGGTAKTFTRRKKSFSTDKISSIINFIRDYENQSALKKIKKELAALIHYLMPKRLEGKILFGTGDPCTTGWLLGVISMFRVAYTEGLTILPDFEEKVFVADGYMKGKVRAVYFLRLVLRGYMDDHIKGCITKALNLI